MSKAKKEVKQEVKLEHVVDRYGIMPYADTKAIVVNAADGDKASEALSEKDIIHRTFDSTIDLANEVAAEKGLMIATKETPHIEKVSVKFREEYAKDIVDVVSLGEGLNGDMATDFLLEKGLPLSELAKEDLSIPAIKEPETKAVNPKAAKKEVE